METTQAVRARTIAHRVQQSPVPHRSCWPLDPDLTFLNHGSYGVCPRPILEAQRHYRARMERDPVSWFMRDQEALLDGAREALGGLIGCRGEDIGWTPNATVAIATVLHAMEWRQGDEILVCDQEYMSAINEGRRLGDRRGVRLVIAPLTTPVHDEDEIVERIVSRVSGRTRLAIISHITSPSAIVMPVQRLTRELRARGVDVLIDGAHGPGQIDIDLTRLDATYYVATLHKWVCAPKGAGMLWVNPDRQGEIRPMALSSRAHEDRPWRSRFLRDFDYHGTDDHTPQICVKDAISFMAGLLPGAFDELYRSNHDLVVRARDLICDQLQIAPVVPASMVPMIATIQIPPVPGALAAQRTVFGDPMQDRLVAHHKIQVPIWTNALTQQRYCRISAQVYNTLDQYERLGEAMREELARESCKT